MSSAVLRGIINVVHSSTGRAPSFEYGEGLGIYIEDRSEVPKTAAAKKPTSVNGFVLLGRKAIRLTQDTKFPLEFQCEYDPTQASSDQFDKLCKEGLITVGAEIIDGRGDMVIYSLRSGPQKFEQNIKLTLEN